ncbi:putative carboxylesterase 6 [Lasiodiplodia theobromae]|uniref:Putative carboxylesterase 6 n=1 Tax=Lasiodiplodia theobromae TaxID=45133 RepID=A0A5N5CZY5_9PEZI|nr:putative carboxylesterase 6 [Lasiodiplodia theobromae]
MAQFNPDDFSRFDNFRIFRATYKTVSNHALTTDVLVPIHLLFSPQLPRPSPLLLRFHGGGLIAGSSLFPDFFAPWQLALAHRHSAIIVSPNYRLLPESSVADILADIEDFWAWIHSSLAAFLAQQTPGVRVDTGRIITAGDSAGGYLSLQLGISHADQIRAVTAAYPMVDVLSRHFTEAYEKRMFGMPQFPRSFIDEHLEKVRTGALPSVVSEDKRFERGALMFAMTQDGFCREYFPRERRELFPLERVGSGGERFPRGGVFVWHGRQDSIVPVEGSVKLEEVVRRVDPGAKFRLTIRDGDHGFDGQSSVDDDWMAEGLKGIVDAWLA